MLSVYRADPLYYSDRTAYQHAIEYVAASAQQRVNGLGGDLVLIQSYGTPLWHYTLNYARLPVAWYALPLQFPDPAHPLTDLSALVDQMSATTCRIWLVNELTEFPGEFELERNWLAAHWRLDSETEFTDADRTVKVSLFMNRGGC